MKKFACLLLLCGMAFAGDCWNTKENRACTKEEEAKFPAIASITIADESNDCPRGTHRHPLNMVYTTMPPVYGDGLCHEDGSDKAVVPGVTIEPAPAGSWTVDVKKPCAFDLKPQVRWSGWKDKPHEPSAKETFDSSLGRDPNVSTWGGLLLVGSVPRASCPYERAIELFGEERVSFEDQLAIDVNVHQKHHNKRVKVDDEVVYEEQTEPVSSLDTAQ